jgi:hypothetical protein
MNNWINANKIKLYSCSEAFARECNLQLVEAIPVSALEELFSKSGEQLAREMFPYTEDDFSWITDCRRSDFLEAYNLQEVKIAELKKERDAYYDELHAKRIEVEELTATCKKWYDAAMYFQDMGKIGINMEDPNMRKIPDAGEFDPNRPGVY